MNGKKQETDLLESLRGIVVTGLKVLEFTDHAKIVVNEDYLRRTTGKSGARAEVIIEKTSTGFAINVTTRETTEVTQ